MGGRKAGVDAAKHHPQIGRQKFHECRESIAGIYCGYRKIRQQLQQARTAQKSNIRAGNSRPMLKDSL
ncbi:hypothetical protein SMATCC274_41280 [Serratia marcescens]|nr:hypothetical protein SMATCC274_41280 [Serratia marcescens]